MSVELDLGVLHRMSRGYLWVSSGKKSDRDITVAAPEQNSLLVQLPLQNTRLPGASNNNLLSPSLRG